MRNAVFQVPSWRCADQANECGPGTTLRAHWSTTLPGGTALGPSALATSVLPTLSAASLGTACGAGTRPFARFAETTAAGADAQSACCVGQCPPGTRNDNGWCEPCAAGEMSATTDATSCAACGAGTFAPTGSAACSQCTVGQTDHDQSAATPCIDCDAGRFSDSASSDAVCAGVCSTSSYAAEGSTAGCQDCSPGQYDDDSDVGTPCRLCPANTFAIGVGGTVCESCPEGRASIGGSTSCSAGQVAPVQQRCPAEWAACVGADGCNEELAAALAACSGLPTVGSAPLRALLACTNGNGEDRDFKFEYQGCFWNLAGRGFAREWHPCFVCLAIVLRGSIDVTIRGLLKALMFCSHTHGVAVDGTGRMVRNTP